MTSLCLNGHFLPASAPALAADNRSFRYGDGLFETMKMIAGNIILADLHFQRLHASLELLGIQLPKHHTPELLQEHIHQLAIKNNCQSLARIRLTIFRGEGGLFEGGNQASWLIECWPLSSTSNQLNTNGLVTGIYPDARKSTDKFSRIKSNSALVYSLAARYAQNQKWNDAFVLNTHDRIADSTIANLFLVKDNRIITPPLSEGAIAGTMRSWLIDHLPQIGLRVEQTPISPAHIPGATECFLSNAIAGIKWIANHNQQKFGNTIAKKVYAFLADSLYT